MANKNANLQNAKKTKDDEFYTRYEDIENEVMQYKKHFNNKIVLCNCDDPFESNFCKFFLKNFNILHLKRLICTTYYSSKIATKELEIFKDVKKNSKKHGYVLDVTKFSEINGSIPDEIIYDFLEKFNCIKKLNGDGDFQSDECVEYIKLSDIIVTNPPFSLFREFVSIITKFNKKFLIIGNQNALTYKEIFPLIKDNKIWWGKSIHSGDRKFYVPDNYPLNASTCGIDENGKRFVNVKGIRWWTNVKEVINNEPLDLYKKYSFEDYPKYDNYDAINVDKTCDIPIDYEVEKIVTEEELNKLKEQGFIIEIIEEYYN